MKRIFIVHGHALETRDKVKKFLETLGLEPVILSDQANQGGTVIEKFEREAEASNYAIVLLTGDDVGREADGMEKGELFSDTSTSTKFLVTAVIKPILQHAPPASEFYQLKLRARQNVILELGYFVGRLGRKHVCVLADDNVELPSDIVGIATISTSHDWEPILLKELQAVQLVP